MSDKMMCMACGIEDTPQRRIKGNILIEIILWLCFLLPGLIYTIWRLSTRARVCRHCGSEHLVPPSSPMAKKLKADLRDASTDTTPPPDIFSQQI